MKWMEYKKTLTEFVKFLILPNITSEQPKENIDKMDTRIFQLCEQLSENLAHNWTLEEMAKAINASESHFIKLFKNATGNPPIAWLRDERLKEACKLLEGDWEHINHIALKVGMPNESHFTRDFKNKYGLTPTAYRKQYWDKKQAERLLEQK